MSTTPTLAVRVPAELHMLGRELLRAIRSPAVAEAARRLLAAANDARVADTLLRNADRAGAENVR